MPDDRQTEPHRAVDPDAHLVVHGELTGDDLVAAVFADPDSDAPRLVYGDYLLDRGDPRGELIQLQLQRHATGEPAGERERALLYAHGQAWTEPLWHGLEAASIRFERGFLYACRTVGNLALRDCIGHPLWSTVEQLESDELALVVSPCMRSMRRLRTRIEPLERLCHVAHRVAVERIELYPSFPVVPGPAQGIYRERWNNVSKVGALTAVRELALDVDDANPANALLVELLKSRLGLQLERLELWTTMPHPLHAWERALRDHLSLRAIGCSVHHYRHGQRDHHAVTLLERAPDGTVAVVLELTEARVPSDETLHVLQSFATTSHRSLAIRYRAGDPEIDAAALEAIRRRVSPAFHEVLATPARLPRR
ncbi:MAG: TIGR02996 domain-containing protein [Deltaproteobacteria bacterium]|nr:TIGR02996 domain-containing protein [Deltaproteobacteria bacterium]